MEFKLYTNNIAYEIKFVVRSHINRFPSHGNTRNDGWAARNALG